ncbi:V-set domain-containing T-cell activation inhibitor 1 [Austrofundulus limnaeus]|uniref:V-set domain-containing T-cell activation inhibitor 1 n=1 Tax=Austrofundulus limnaeus TaxID=52670 RepID=A0A2I4DCX2_AUSLI|nr:PREDICTED: V-set domain-containing T-cell activation inhibitor 1-like [Austrofundulus limnaeus]
MFVCRKMMFFVFGLLVHGFQYSLASDINEIVEFVVLPYKYLEYLSDNPTVTWSRYDLSPPTVHLRREEDDLQDQNQHFSGRTSMKLDALDSGDFSLTLRKPHLSDSGTYTCSISSEREEIKLTDVQLQVKGQ